jgi:ATP-dependent exoDNAse (exonuclease V) beta subunit
MNPDIQRAIEIISAGAGSGKTHTLTNRMAELLKQDVRPEGILATTFTQKAAAELQERVRLRLLEEGRTREADAIGNALIGTVHSIGARLLQRFAYEAGVSPLVEIIADGDEQRLFNESLAQVLTESRIETMNALSDRLGFTKKDDGEYDWRKTIRTITEVARANNFSPEVLEKSKIHSRESFARLLPPTSPATSLNWQNRLGMLLDQTIAALEDHRADDTKTTRDVIEYLRQITNQFRWRGFLYWHEWVKISKQKVGAKSREIFEPLREFTRSHDEHAEFQRDNAAFTDLAFDIAQDALREYAQYKKKRGLIDYTDMETFVSALLRVESVRDTLQQELDLLLVDEFQDTSPIQLDIFLQLSLLAKKSIWVGDPKQSIYGFRGAEPALMQAIMEAAGGVRENNILNTSYRSRPDLVYAANAIFTRAFSNLPKAQIELTPANPEPVSIAAPRALQHWHFRFADDDRKTPGKPWLDNCIAAQIRTFLAREIPVWNKKRDQTRPARPGDVAILCRTNEDCIQMAEALNRAGLQAAVAQEGLLETAEARLVLACLKYLVTPSDQLSLAEILVISGRQTLEEMVNNRLRALQENPENAPSLASGGDPLLAKLQQIRPLTAELSAAELTELLLDTLELRRTVARLGQVTQRLDNLDRFRRYALDYESACQRLHSAASISGFLLWLNRLAEDKLDLKAAGESPDTVRVMTYHKSKGLEFPITVCHHLDQGLRERVWGVNLENEIEKPDLNNILGHRRLRLWMNPYSDQIKGTRLEENLLNSPEWALANRQALDEDARLLYVGITRARDYLILPTTGKGTRWLNRVFSEGNESAATLDPESEETPFVYNDRVIYCAVEQCYFPREFPEIEVTPEQVNLPALPEFRPPEGLRPYRLDPYTEGAPLHRPTDPTSFAPALSFDGAHGPALDAAVKAFVRSDRLGRADAQRMAAARRHLAFFDQESALKPEHLLRQSAALHRVLADRLQPERMYADFPLQKRLDKRQVELQVDILLEGPNGRTAVLFAPFADNMQKWRERCAALLPFAGWVERLLLEAYPDSQIQVAIVFPLEGQFVFLEK